MNKLEQNVVRIEFKGLMSQAFWIQRLPLETPLLILRSDREH